MIVKRLTYATRRINGRDARGHIASCHRAGGHKRRYRIIDFYRNFESMPALVIKFEYDPNRNASIALVRYYNEVLSYIIACKDLKVGNIIMTDLYDPEHIPGNCSSVGIFRSGSIVHNLELHPLFGGKYARSSGTSVQILKTYSNKFVAVKLPTTEQRLVPIDSKVTFGVPVQLFFNHYYSNYTSAGQVRRLGRRPIVRGVAMNPVDHPHGGAGGRLDRSPWGWLTKGPRTSRMNSNWMLLHTRRFLLERKLKKIKL